MILALAQFPGATNFGLSRDPLYKKSVTMGKNNNQTSRSGSNANASTESILYTANQIQCDFIFIGCAQLTLIRFAKFLAKTVFIVKLLQNNSNLNDFEYSTDLKAKIIEKRQKKILKAEKNQRWKNPNVHNIFDF